MKRTKKKTPSVGETHHSPQTSTSVWASKSPTVRAAGNVDVNRLQHDHLSPVQEMTKKTQGSEPRHGKFAAGKHAR